MEEETRITVADLLDKNIPLNHRKNIMKGLVDQIPILGPIITEYIPNVRHEKLVVFVIQLQNDFEKFKEKIDQDYIHKEEIILLIQDILISANRLANHDKIQAFRGILLNSVTDKNIGIDLKEYYLSVLNNLTSIHIKILGFFRDPESFVKERKIHIDSEPMYGYSWDQIAQECFPEIDKNLLNSITTDLQRMNLLIPPPTAQTASKGLNLVSNKLTEFGKKFIDFCTIKE